MADEAVIWSTVSAVVGGTIGSIAGWMVKRVEKAPDIQATLSAAIADVVKHYKEALDRSDGESAALRIEVADLRRLVEDQSARIEDQSAEIESLVAHVEQLNAALVALGGKPPAKPSRRRSQPTEAAK